MNRRDLDHKSNETAGVIAPPPFLFGGALALGLAVNALVPAHLLSRRRAVLRHAGAVFVGLGVAVSASAVRAFRKAGTAISPLRPTSRVVFTGPYRYTRNPDYIAQFLIYVGASIEANTWWPLFLAPVVMMAVQRGVIRREERYLEARFGQAYRDYADRVPRWLWPADCMVTG